MSDAANVLGTGWESVTAAGMLQAYLGHNTAQSRDT